MNIEQHIERQNARQPAPLFGEGFSDEMRKTTTLTKWLELETWPAMWAALLVCGIQPPDLTEFIEIPQKGAMGLDNCFMLGTLDPFHEARRILLLWNCRENAPAKVRPADFVAWCKTKGINTDWLREAANTEPTEMPCSMPIARQTAQETSILNEIRALGYEPKSIPANMPGKAGVKLKVRSSLTYSSSVFDKAWERLRSSREIQEAR